VVDSGLLLLLIMSVAQMGVILCKVSESGGRYERVVDFGNRMNDGCIGGKARGVLLIRCVKAVLKPFVIPIGKSGL
jgi:hypothetical protein